MFDYRSGRKAVQHNSNESLNNLYILRRNAVLLYYRVPTSRRERQHARGMYDQLTEFIIRRLREEIATLLDRVYYEL